MYVFNKTSDCVFKPSLGKIIDFDGSKHATRRALFYHEEVLGKGKGKGRAKEVPGAKRRDERLVVNSL